MSSTVRTPPPTVSGMKQASAVRVTTSNMVPAVVGGGGDVEEGQFVGAGGVIGLGGLDRVACIDQVDELHALDDAAVLHVEAGDDAHLEGHATLAARISAMASAGSSRPS